MSRVTNDPKVGRQRRRKGRVKLLWLSPTRCLLRVISQLWKKIDYQQKSKLSFDKKEGVILNFRNEYLRRPNPDDLARLLHMGKVRGFPGMLGNIDCMHWEWKNCPTALAGQYGGRSRKPTIVLEAVASYDLWIWHAFFGTPGSLNDINVLQRSPLFNELLEESAPAVNFTVNGMEYNMGYYLADGIYPGSATFVKSINAPQIQKHLLFAARQESCRKDVERAFGVLQARFAFIKRPCLLWDPNMMGKVPMTCIIMHNMIFEDERENYLNYESIIEEFKEDNPNSATDDQYEYHRRRRSTQERFIEIHGEIRDHVTHNALKNDLIEHIWENFS
ncbi:uncharacterized protein LOC141639678 [Silene latifolia]|uniref:uncharacterized protein LOC141639678 n=1 Tax=Silene latifolia TaxID=37657 RepID=UPI003D781AAF